uniref:Putative secreted protein n=1 Tax=Anopheles darlingi TaxID=43151 RepID=A0A2M4DLM8_ANODA
MRDVPSFLSFSFALSSFRFHLHNFSHCFQILFLILSAKTRIVAAPRCGHVAYQPFAWLLVMWSNWISKRK